MVFTNRFAARKGEVLFDQICRQNGIKHLLTGVRAPTTTGKIERFHKTLRAELFSKQRFDTVGEAQQAIDRYIEYYNTLRPHQSIGMMTPAERFRVGEQRKLLEDQDQVGRPDDSDAYLRKVGTTGSISFAGVSYTVGRMLAGQMVAVKLEREMVWILHEGQAIRAYPHKHPSGVKEVIYRAHRPKRPKQRSVG